MIDSCDSGVLNFLLEDGCSAAGLIAELAEGARNHGAFARALAHLTNEWVKQGFMTGADKGALQSCGGRARIR